MNALSVTYERGERFREFIDALVGTDNTEEEKSHRMFFATRLPRWSGPVASSVFVGSWKYHGERESPKGWIEMLHHIDVGLRMNYHPGN
jgi:hypothetical protein